MIATTLDEHLKIERCPHCSVDNPNLTSVRDLFSTVADNNTNSRNWRVYACKRCGGVVIASSRGGSKSVNEIYPSPQSVNQNLPERVREYLKQAIDSTFAPSGSVMLCASSVDAMLKEKGLTEGSLHKRIGQAVDNNLITPEMGVWAHQVRIGANEERHSDLSTTMPNVDDAKQAIEFTKTLGELLFILPSKVERGIEATKQDGTK